MKLRGNCSFCSITLIPVGSLLNFGQVVAWLLWACVGTEVVGYCRGPYWLSRQRCRQCGRGSRPNKFRLRLILCDEFISADRNKFTKIVDIQCWVPRVAICHRGRGTSDWDRMRFFSTKKAPQDGALIVWSPQTERWSPQTECWSFGTPSLSKHPLPTFAYRKKNLVAQAVNMGLFTHPPVFLRSYRRFCTNQKSKSYEYKRCTNKKKTKKKLM